MLWGSALARADRDLPHQAFFLRSARERAAHGLAVVFGCAGNVLCTSLRSYSPVESRDIASTAGGRVGIRSSGGLLISGWIDGALAKSRWTPIQTSLAVRLI